MTTNVRLSSAAQPERENNFFAMVDRRTSSKSAVIQRLVDLVLDFEKKNGRLPEWDRAAIVETVKQAGKS